MRESVDVYFHVGEGADIEGKAGVTVPLTGQGTSGAANVLQWAAQTRLVPQSIASHDDVVSHARHCAAQYSHDHHVVTMKEASRRVAGELIGVFPEVLAVLGTGFPWYCANGRNDEVGPVPESIRHYTGTQASLFAGKVLPADLAREALSDSGIQHVADELAQRGVELGQSTFNAYEYERWGVSPPLPRGADTMRGHFGRNLVELGGRDWPCHLCTTLHNRMRFPRQTWERDFMRSCLDCHQTSFIPRAVGVLGSDIDVIAVVEDNVSTADAATRIATWIDLHDTYFRHDVDWSVQLGAAHGPLDVFVVRRSDFVRAARAIAVSERWMEITVSATVTWLPVTPLDYEIGKYFVLCIEPLADRGVDAAFLRDWDAARRQFAAHVPVGALLAFYEQDSTYLRQLASNRTVRDFLGARLGRWSLS